MFDDRRIKDNIAIFSKLDSAAEHLIKPKFKSNIPKGGEGIWSVFNCFCWEIDQRLAVDFLAGIFARPSTHASTVIGLLGANRAFQALYRKHMRSPVAVALANSDHPDLSNPNTLYTSVNLTDWNFEESTAGTDPVMRVVKRDIISFVSPPVQFVSLFQKLICPQPQTRERQFGIIARTRSDIPLIMVARKTLGITLLSSAGWDGPRTRSKRANVIINKMYPNHNGVSLGDVASDKALVELFCSESTMAAANNLVDTVGAINIALGSYRTVKSFLIPWEIIPLAAALVSHLSFSS